MDSTFEIGSNYGKIISENNKLQKLVTGLKLRLDICQIVVIGSQSAGKSSVLEKIVGKKFLPTGKNCVTKRPLYLNLFQSDQSKAEISYFDCDKELDVKQTNLNLNQLAKAIKQANTFKDGKQFTSQPINVTISGPHNPDLTLIDLPGVTADPNERRIIIDMIKPIINKDTSIILAVSGANDDLKNSNAIHLAQDADPQGERTIGVLTKVDLVQQEIYTEKLTEFGKEHICIKYIAVQNSPDTKMKDSILQECEFFKKHNDDENGSEKLKTFLSMQLIKKIKEKVPEHESKIRNSLSAMKVELNGYQDFTNEDFQAKFIHDMARDFEKKLKADIGYPSSEMTPDDISHGAIIFEILKKWFSMQNGIIWNDQQQENNKWYLRNPRKQEEMLKAINKKQRNVRGAFNFTSKAETVMQEIIKKELDYMIELPNRAIGELVSQLRQSYIEICENLDDKYQNFSKLIDTMKNEIEKQIWKAERENENQIKRYFNQEKELINSGHKDFAINFERKQMPVKYSDQKIETNQQPLLNDKLQTDPGVGAAIGLAEVTGNSNLETRESLELNILNFRNDSNRRKKFYESSKLNHDMWEDDAIILEGSLKHLQIIQDALSDKLPKIIHYEIFHSTKIFVEQELASTLIDEWKQNKDIMSANESQRERRQKLEKDIEKNKNALEIVSRMTRMIKNANQSSYQKPLPFPRDENSDYEEDMDGSFLQLSEITSGLKSFS